MADITFAPPVPTLERVARAWAALTPRRRQLVCAGTAAAIAPALAAISVVPVTSVVVLVAVGVVAAAAAVVDVHEHRLPNRLLGLSAVLVLAAASLDGSGTLVAVAVSTLMAALPLWLVRYGKGVGIGDVKFAAVLGAAGGLIHPFAGLVVVWCAALASGVFAYCTRRHRLALGPWLWAGFVAAAGVAVVAVHVFEQIGGQPWPAAR